MTIYPKISTSIDQTSAPLLTSEAVYPDCEIDLMVRLDQCLRQNTPPKEWETYWVMWSYLNNFRHYYWHPKNSGGWVLGKKDLDSNIPDQNITLLATNKGNYTNVGEPYHFRLKKRLDRITIWIDDIQIIDYYDKGGGTLNGIHGAGPPMSPILGSSGKLGIYDEDSRTTWWDVKFSPIAVS